MQSFKYSLPTTLICGDRSRPIFLQELRENFGKCALVLTGKHLSKNIYLEEIHSDLVQIELDLCELPLEYSMSLVDLLGVARNIRNSTGNFDLIIAIGGGSVMDNAKVLSIMVSNQESLGHLHDTISICTFLEQMKSKVPIVCIPTTIGTGSESNGTFATYDGSKSKITLRNFSCRPQIAWLEPRHVSDLPLANVRDGLWDCLSHLLEQLNDKELDSIWSDRMLIGLIFEVIELFDLIDEWAGSADLRERAMLASFWAMSYLFSVGKTIEWSLHKKADGVPQVESHSKHIQKVLGSWILDFQAEIADSEKRRCVEINRILDEVLRLKGRF